MCTSPITVTIKEPNNIGGLRRVVVPCGKCIQCLKAYQNAWTVRVSEEFKNYGYGIFFTLTYRPDCVPTVVDSHSGCLYFSVCKSHVQDWIKRFRTRSFRASGNVTELKYFITSEYGPRTFRPHYHGIIFGIDELSFRSLLNDWQNKFGFASYSVIPASNSGGACRYVAKYCSKGVFENPLVAAKIVRPTFHLVSKGLGLSYVDRMKDYHLGADITINKRLDKFYDRVADRSKVYLGAFAYKMPRYYKNKIYGEKTYLSRKVADHLHEKSVRLLDKELVAIQSERHCSFGEACHIHDCFDDAQRLSASEQQFQVLNRDYNKSQI